MTAIQAIWGPGWNAVNGVASTVNSRIINDANDVIACVYQAPQDGTIDRISFYASSSGSQTLNIALVTLDSNGHPTTTNYGGSATETFAISSSGKKNVTLATPAIAVRGDLFAVRIWRSSGAGSTTVVGGIGSYNTGTGDMFMFPCNTQSADAGATWTYGSAAPSIAAGYDDGSWCGSNPGGMADISSSTAYNSSSTPDEYGGRFVPPFSMTVSGIRLPMLIGVGTTAIINLYNSGGSILATATLYPIDGANSRIYAAIFDNAVQCISGSTYYVGLTNSSGATNNRGPTYYTFDVSTQRGGFPFVAGSAWAKATRTDAGAWTIDDTSLPCLALILEGAG